MANCGARCRWKLQAARRSTRICPSAATAPNDCHGVEAGLHTAFFRTVAISTNRELAFSTDWRSTRKRGRWRHQRDVMTQRPPEIGKTIATLQSRRHRTS